MKVISTLMAILVITLAALFLRNLEGQPFLGAAPDPVQADVAFQKALKTIEAFPATQSVQEVSVDPHAITLNQKTLNLTLIDHPITATKVRTEEVTNPDGSQSILWFGNLEPHASVQPDIPQWQDPQNSITLVKSGETITGMIRQGSQLFEIRPVGADRHVVVVLDGTKMPPEREEPLLAKPPSGKKTTASSRSLVPSADPTLTHIEVMTVVPQNTVAEYQGDMVALMQLAVALANQSYINSMVGIRLRLVAYQVTDDMPKARRPGAEPTRPQNFKDEQMDDLIALRNKSSADVVVYIFRASPTGDGALSCGQTLRNGSAADTAFAMVNYKCIANFAFTRGIGRLQSLR